jgi:hypothetical protein
MAILLTMTVAASCQRAGAPGAPIRRTVEPHGRTARAGLRASPGFAERSRGRVERRAAATCRPYR